VLYFSEVICLTNDQFIRFFTSFGLHTIRTNRISQQAFTHIIDIINPAEKELKQYKYNSSKKNNKNTNP